MPSRVVIRAGKEVRGIQPPHLLSGMANWNYQQRSVLGGQAQYLRDLRVTERSDHHRAQLQTYRLQAEVLAGSTDFHVYVLVGSLTVFGTSPREKKSCPRQA